MTRVISVRGRKREELLADPNFVYVGRRCAGWPASIWGNPFKVGMDPFPAMRIFDAIPDEDFHQAGGMAINGKLTAEEAVEWFRQYVQMRKSLWSRLGELKGKTLGCWCGCWLPGEPEICCHAVVLAKLAEQPA